jgi:hypothetical protein
MIITNRLPLHILFLGAPTVSALMLALIGSEEEE